MTITTIVVIFTDWLATRDIQTMIACFHGYATRLYGLLLTAIYRTLSAQMLLTYDAFLGWLATRLTSLIIFEHLKLTFSHTIPPY